MKFIKVWEFLQQTMNNRQIVLPIIYGNTYSINMEVCLVLYICPDEYFLHKLRIGKIL